MKKSIKKTAVITWSIVILIISNYSSFSQTSKFGLSFNSLTTNFNYGKSNQSLQSFKRNFKGLQIGAFYQIGITKKFSVVPELYFAMKGGILNENNPETLNKSTLRTWSLESPVLARYHYKNFYVNAGPYVSYLFAGRIKTEASGNIPGTTSHIKFGNSPNEFKHFDVGAQIGAGYNFNLKKSVLALDVRYGYGLLNISNNIERYNRMLNISLVLSKNKSK